MICFKVFLIKDFKDIRLVQNVDYYFWFLLQFQGYEKLEEGFDFVCV